MNTGLIIELKTIRTELNNIIENNSEKLIDSTKSRKLKEDLQRNILDMITQTMEEIDLIFDNINGEEYEIF